MDVEQSVIADTPRVRRAAGFVAVIAWVGILLSLYNHYTLTEGDYLYQAFIYAGYLTYVTNWFVAIVATLLALPGEGRLRRFVRNPNVFSLAVIAIVLVMIAYEALLREEFILNTLDGVADIFVHYLTPLVMILLWAYIMPANSLTLKDVLYWISYPVAYMLYIVPRGELTGEYPYEFADVTQVGYDGFIVSSGMVFAMFILVSIFFLVANHFPELYNKI